MGVTKLFRKRTRFRRAGGICGDQNEPWGTLYGIECMVIYGRSPRCNSIKNLLE